MLDLDVSAVFRLTIGYALAGAFVATLIGALLSFLGWLALAERRHTRRVLAIAAMQGLILVAGLAAGLITLQPRDAVAALTAPLYAELDAARADQRRAEAESVAFASAIATLEKQRRGYVTALEGTRSAYERLGAVEQRLARARRENRKLRDALARAAYAEDAALQGELPPIER